MIDDPLDQFMPTPQSMWKSWMRSRKGLWFYDLCAGYDWDWDTAYEMLKGETIADPALLSRQIALNNLSDRLLVVQKV